jgi:hypothetical protein
MQTVYSYSLIIYSSSKFVCVYTKTYTKSTYIHALWSMTHSTTHPSSLSNLYAGVPRFPHPYTTHQWSETLGKPSLRSDYFWADRRDTTEKQEGTRFQKQLTTKLIYPSGHRLLTSTAMPQEKRISFVPFMYLRIRTVQRGQRLPDCRRQSVICQTSCKTSNLCYPSSSK